MTITKSCLVHRINTRRQSDTSHLTVSTRSFTYRAITENTALSQIIFWFNEPRQLTPSSVRCSRPITVWRLHAAGLR